MGSPECLFCRIVSRQIPAQVVAEEPELVAFNDINPQAPTHLLIIPKEHITSLAETTEAHTMLMGNALQLANRLARKLQLGEGYRVVINNGAKAGQSVWHLHLHLLGGRTLTWPPG